MTEWIYSMALTGATIDTATELFPSESGEPERASSPAAKDMYQLLLSHLPVARTIAAGVDLTTIAADGAGRISVMKRILAVFQTVLLAVF